MCSAFATVSTLKVFALIDTSFVCAQSQQGRSRNEQRWRSLHDYSVGSAICCTPRLFHAVAGRSRYSFVEPEYKFFLY